MSANDDETVTVIQSANNYRRCYHTDPDGCQSVSEDHDTEEITKEKADRLNLEACSWCEGEVEKKTYDRSALEAAQNYDPEPIDEVVAND